jgi:predicted nicotinamide N-methyase
MAFFAALDAQTGSTQKNPSRFISKKIKNLGWRNRHSQSDWYPVTLNISDHTVQQFRVLQVQRGEVEGTYGTGATVWPASMVLLKYMEKHADQLIRGRIVVDLGSGTGITSIGAVFLGAERVICTDGETAVVRLAGENVSRAIEDGLDSTKIQVSEYWWGTGTLPTEDADIVIVSDCVLPKLYLIAPLVEALDQLLIKPGALAILSYEYRYFPEYDPKEKFIELASAKMLELTVISIDDQDDVYSAEDIEIWHVQRRKPD